MQQLVPNIWCQGTADDAAAFYLEAFPEATIVATEQYPTEGLLDFQQPFAGQTLTVSLELTGRPADDDGAFPLLLLNAGNEFRPTPAISIMVNFDPAVHSDAAERLEASWAKLGDGGIVRMPLDAYPFSERYGWVEDRYGVNWQLILTNSKGEPRPEFLCSFLFTGPEIRAKAALTKYAALFPDSHLGNIVEFGPEAGAELDAGVMFGEAKLYGTWCTASDGGSDHEFTFSEGVSLMVFCRDQAEIDRYWDALSHHPEAEACGWCKDEFGVSWQIVPADLERLMGQPGAYEKLLGMKRIVIDEFTAP